MGIVLREWFRLHVFYRCISFFFEAVPTVVLVTTDIITGFSSMHITRRDLHVWTYHELRGDDHLYLVQYHLFWVRIFRRKQVR